MRFLPVAVVMAALAGACGSGVPSGAADASTSDGPTAPPPTPADAGVCCPVGSLCSGAAGGWAPSVSECPGPIYDGYQRLANDDHGCPYIATGGAGSRCCGCITPAPDAGNDASSDASPE